MNVVYSVFGAFACFAHDAAYVLCCDVAGLRTSGSRVPSRVEKAFNSGPSTVFVTSTTAPSQRQCPTTCVLPRNLRVQDHVVNIRVQHGSLVHGHWYGASHIRFRVRGMCRTNGQTDRQTNYNT